MMDLVQMLRRVNKRSLPAMLCMMLVLSAWAKSEPFWQKMLRIFGISATSSKQKGGKVYPGDIYLTAPSQGRLKLTSGANFRFPIFQSDDKALLALQGDNIVRVPRNGSTRIETLFRVSGIVKLVGASLDKPSEVLVIIRNGRLLKAAIVNAQLRTVTYDPTSPKDEQMLLRAAYWKHGDTELFVDETKSPDEEGRSWTDIYLRNGKESVNLSNSDGFNCSQPSLSHFGNYVTYIAERNN